MLCVGMMVPDDPASVVGALTVAAPWFDPQPAAVLEAAGTVLLSMRERIETMRNFTQGLANLFDPLPRLSVTVEEQWVRLEQAVLLDLGNDDTHRWLCRRAQVLENNQFEAWRIGQAIDGEAEFIAKWDAKHGF